MSITFWRLTNFIMTSLPTSVSEIRDRRLLIDSRKLQWSKKLDTSNCADIVN